MYLDETQLVKLCLLGIDLRSPTCYLLMMAVLKFNVYDKAFWIHRSHSEATKSFAHGLIISTQYSISLAMAVCGCCKRILLSDLAKGLGVSRKTRAGQSFY